MTNAASNNDQWRNPMIWPFVGGINDDQPTTVLARNDNQRNDQ